VVTPEHILERLTLGLEQGEDTVLPQVSVWKDTDEFILKMVPSLLAEENCLHLIAHPHDGAAFCPHGLGTYTRCNLMIGPEGGDASCNSSLALVSIILLTCHLRTNPVDFVFLSIPGAGGFVTPEMSTWTNLGFTPVSLGRRILPVATAIHVLHGILHAEM
jgi:16S rRNA U1498 N3-methylase RsmE